MWSVIITDLRHRSTLLSMARLDLATVGITGAAANSGEKMDDI
jgi:hypothetical protein